MKSIQLSLPKSHKLCFVIALGAGALVTLAHPPFGFLPVLLLAFPLFYALLLSTESCKRAFYIGWAFGFGHFVTSLYWIAYSLVVEPDMFAWLIPFSVCLIPAVLAFYPAFVSYIFYRWFKHRMFPLLAFAALWTIFEILRSVLFTGFPWNLMGYVWTVDPAFTQLAAYVGVLGLGFIAVCIALLPTSAVSFGDGITFNKKAFVRISVLIALCILAIWQFGVARIDYWHKELAKTPNQNPIRIKLVQVSSPAYYRWDPNERMQEFMKHVMFTDTQMGAKEADIVVWPESAAPFYLEEDQEIRGLMAEVAPENGIIITGSKRKEQNVEGNWQIWNSMMAIDATGAIRAVYDKERLVPFGEFVPFAEYLPFVKKVTHGSINFSRGPGRQTLAIDSLPTFSPLVCYEVIFPGDAVSKETRPDFIVNVTNDAWFRKSLGPYQHFNMAMMRAVEEGLPLVRSANTGISGVFDGTGRAVAFMPLYHIGVLDVVLPVKLPQTFFSNTGNLPVMVLSLLIIAGVSFSRKRIG